MKMNDAPQMAARTARRTPSTVLIAACITFQYERRMVRERCDGGAPDSDTTLIQCLRKFAAALMLDGRVALITGANTGIGRVTAVDLTRRGARVFLACRSEERTRPVIDQIRAARPGASVEWLPLELSDFDSVRACARMFLDRGLPLHLLINNAGVAGVRGLTRAGFEWIFGVNHMGHFLLTQLLLERMRSSAPARIVTVASRAHKRVGGIDWSAVRKPAATPGGVKEYCVSKLANVLFSAELARRLEGSGVSTYSLHPGV